MALATQAGREVSAPKQTKWKAVRKGEKHMSHTGNTEEKTWG